ncbi:SPOR domain-containing protein [Oleidesulfovibrio sp.]|uniref:SPOR domain-containing protein n=1 Tax=Oleidesulfovibrio sp. TaxID=2909707 RepID=UPI003A88FA2C
MSFSIRNEAGSNGKRRFIIEMTAGKFFFTCFLLLFGFAWMFTFGIMIGRGFNPDESVPALARLMPDTGTPVEVPKHIADDTKGSTPPGVIKTEELGLLTSLRAKDTDPKQQKPAVAPPKETPKAPERPAVPATQQKQQNSGATTYRYVYQVASLKDVGAAKRFASHLEEAGLNASVERVDTSKGVWHRVNVAFRGTTADAENLKRKLSALGIRKPLLKEQEALSK